MVFFYPITFLAEDAAITEAYLNTRAGKIWVIHAKEKILIKPLLISIEQCFM